MVFLLGFLLSSGPERIPAAPLTPGEEVRRDALTRFGLGILRSRNDLPIQAIKQYEAAAKADENAVEPLRPLVKLYADMGRDPAAIRTAQKVLKLDPDDADTARLLGRLLFEAKRFAESSDAFAKAAASPQVVGNPVKKLGALRDAARAAAAANESIRAEQFLRDADKLADSDRAKLLKSPVFATPAELDRERVRIREGLGESLRKQKKFAEARETFQSVANLASEETDKARVDWHLAEMLAEQGKPAEALVHLNRFLEYKPAGPEAYDRLVEWMRQAGQGNSVAAALEEQVRKNPKNESIRWVQATEVGRNDPETGNRMFRELAETTADPALFQRLVRFTKDCSRPDWLLAIIDSTFRASRVVTDDDPVPETRDARGRAATARAKALSTAVKHEKLIAGGLLRQAGEDVRNGLNRSADTWELLAGLAERDGGMELAETMARNAANVIFSQERGNVNPDRTSVMRYFAILAQRRKWSVLVSETDRFNSVANQRGVTVFSYHYYRAIALAELGDAAALPAIQRVVDVVGDDSKVWARVRRLHILNVLGLHDKAVAEGNDLLNKYSNPTDVHSIRFELSHSYQYLNDHRKAEAELRLVLDDDPDNKLALNNLGYNLADQGRNLAEAEAMIRRAIELDRDERARIGNPEAESGTYLDSLAWVLFRRGNLSEARKLLETAAGTPDVAGDAVVWDHLGDVCFRLGDKPAAKAAWKKANELYTDSHAGRQLGRQQEVAKKLKLVE